MKTRLVANKAYPEERQREYVGTAVIAFLMILPLSCVAREFPKVNEEQLAEYREKFKEDPRRKYVLIHADGSQVHEVSSFRSLYLLNVLADPPGNVISSQDIHELVEGEFGVDIETDSLLSKGKADYLVLSMSRPAENNPRYYFRCGGRDGEHRAYLFFISDGTAKVVSKFFGGCATSYELIRDGNDRGYRVIERGEKVRSVRYMLRGDTLVREPDYHKKGSPR